MLVVLFFWLIHATKKQISLAHWWPDEHFSGTTVHLTLVLTVNYLGVASWPSECHRNQTQKGGAKPNLSAGAERDEFILLPFDSPDTPTMGLIKELNDLLVPSVFLEEKGRTPDREPATSPSPAGHPPLIKAPLSSPSPPTFHRWLYVRPSPTKHRYIGLCPHVHVPAQCWHVFSSHLNDLSDIAVFFQTLELQLSSSHHFVGLKKTPVSTEWGKTQRINRHELQHHSLRWRDVSACTVPKLLCSYFFFYPLWTISNLKPLDWTTRLKPRWLRLMLSLNCSLNSGLLVPFTVLVLSLWASSCTQTCRQECTNAHLHTNWGICKSALNKSECVYWEGLHVWTQMSPYFPPGLYPASPLKSSQGKLSSQRHRFCSHLF